MECVSHFGFKDIDDRNKAFLFSDCWGLRLGAPYQYYSSNELNNALICKHMEQKNLTVTLSSINSYGCLPLSSQGDIFGLLHLEFPQCEGKDQDETSSIFRKTFAEQISLSLSNLKLRTTLRKQSITDPLTGLFNRRYYKENINWIIHKSSLNKQCLAFTMIDIDFFKKFNDNNGHDAGDLVLVNIAELISKFAQDDDVVCRMGGEEFLLLILDKNSDNIQKRLESLRKAAENEVIIYKEQKLQPPTISIGVAFLKEEIEEPERVLIEADKALYKSKEAGRNRITYHELLK
jgi:diguanylate cyclase (GGDEF)-like protein